MSQTDLYVTDGVVISSLELEWRACRSSGPGGQHVNKTSTKVQLSWSPLISSALTEDQRELVIGRLQRRINKRGFITISVDEYRSQQRNIDLARQRLVQLVSRALVKQKVRKATKPSRGVKERRLKAKRQRSQLKAQRSRKDWN